MALLTAEFAGYQGSCGRRAAAAGATMRKFLLFLVLLLAAAVLAWPMMALWRAEPVPAPVPAKRSAIILPCSEAPVTGSGACAFS